MCCGTGGGCPSRDGDTVPPACPAGSRLQRQWPQQPTLVMQVCEAPFSSRARAVSTCPSLAVMCRGVCPAVVARLGLALFSSRSLTMLVWPMRAAQCRGVWSSCKGGREAVLADLDQSLAHHAKRAPVLLLLSHSPWQAGLWAGESEETSAGCSQSWTITQVLCTYLGLGVGFGFVLQQVLCHIHMPCSGCHV